jgi:hypothetical protein
MVKNKVLVIGYYNKENLGDDSYQGIMGNFFPNANLEFIGSHELSKIKAEDYDAIIVGGGDIINNYFNDSISPFLRNFKGPKIAFSIGIPFPSLISEKYLAHFDHVFTRNYEDIRAIQKVLGSHRVHFIPDITLAYSSNYPHKNIISDSSIYLESSKRSEAASINDNSIILGHVPSGENIIKKTCGIFLVGNLIKYPFIVNDISHLISKISLTYNIILYCFNPKEDLKISETVKNLAYKRLNESFTDDKRLKSLLEIARKDNHIRVDSKKYKTQEMIDIISNLDFGVCVRYHSHIFCTIAGTPFVSISSTRKTRSFMKQVGLSEYQYEINLDDYGTPIGSNYEKMRDITRQAIRDKISISEQLTTFLNQSKFLLSNNQASRLLTVSKTDIRTGIENFIQETGDYQNAARLLSSYVIGYPDSPYVWGMYEKFKNIDNKKLLSSSTLLPPTSELSLSDIIYESFQYLTHHGAMLKNDFLNLFNHHNITKSLPLFIDIREYQSYKGAHRGGWYLACEELYKLNSKNEHGEPNGIICDMYVDRTFHWAKTYMSYKGIIPYTGPWCGFIHHTADTSYSNYNTNYLFDIPEFIQSLHTCLALFSLSEPLSKYLRHRLSTLAPHIKVITFAHPVVDPSQSFSIRGYKHNQSRKLINVGAWMRNPFTIYRIENCPLDRTVLVGKDMNDHLPPHNFKIGYSQISTYENLQLSTYDNQTNHPCRSESNSIPRWVLMLIEWISSIGIDVSHYEGNTLYIKNHDRINELNTKIEKMIKSVTQISYQSNEDYDDLLAHNIIFLDLIDAAAVNTIIECIVRRTPLVVNKIPGTTALLGDNYPLYYKHIEEIPNLLTEEKIEHAHQYLKKLDTKRYTIKYFLNQLTDVIKIL